VPVAMVNFSSTASASNCPVGQRLAQQWMCSSGWWLAQEMQHSTLTATILHFQSQ